MFTKSNLPTNSDISVNLAPRPVKNSIVLVANPSTISKNFFSLFITPSASLIILGKFNTAHPIKTVAKKSSILPRNPFV